MHSNSQNAKLKEKKKKYKNEGAIHEKTERKWKKVGRSKEYDTRKKNLFHILLIIK